MSDDNQTNQNSSAGIFGSPMLIQDDSSNSVAVSDVSNIQNKPVENIGISENETKVEKEDGLESIGITFVDDSIQSSKEPNIFSQNSAFRDKEKEVIDSIGNQAIIPETSKSAVVSTPVAEDVPTRELEDDFSKTFNGGAFSSSSIETDKEDHLKIEEEKLKRLHAELKTKATAKKTVVKERLEKLRLEKESLGKEIEEIKEIEGVALKIEEKLKALVSMDTEIDSLEKQAQEELV